jgi:PAS domain S-box-containing protein
MHNSTTHTENPTGPGLGRRVLLVDDNPVQLKLARLQLEYAGFCVEVAPGATAAEAALRHGAPPDAIVSDVVMDGVDGFDLCRRLRKNPTLARTPIVLMSSAFDEEEDRVLARKLGASALVGRSPSQQACVEALVRSLAEGAQLPSSSWRPELYTDRIAHQLVRLSEGRTAAEARNAMLFEYANDAISFATPSGIVLDVNGKWEEITGIPREELRGRHVRDFAAPGHEQVNAEIYTTLAGVSPGRTAPTAIRGRNGSTLFLEFTTAAVEVDGEAVIMSIGRDVTALVEASRRLEASERHYRSLVENIPDVIWSATKDWEFIYFSPNVERLFGYSANDLLAGEHGPPLGRVHPDDLDRARAAREAMSKDGTAIDLECRWQHHDGHWLWLHVRGTRTATGIDGTFTDITARKELEGQLCQAQKLEALGQLTAGIAHDFNNILAVVMMNAGHLAHTLPKGELPWQIACDIVDAGGRGTELTKQLLGFSRRQPCAPRNVDLNALLAGMTRMLDRTVGSRIDIETAQAEGLGQVHADSAQLEQVIMNLVVNARDAMDSAGTLRIETANVDVGLEASGRMTPDSYVRLSVTDSGCGMDAATQQRAFEPFFTTKPADQGTGLGLAICYGIVRSAGGYVFIDSELGLGTTFHVYLPRAPESSAFLRPLQVADLELDGMADEP